MRQLIRRLHRARIDVERELWEVDREGYGQAVYAFVLDGFRYSFCAFVSPLDDHARTDRVIAEAWDATFVLFDGQAGRGDLARLKANVTRQEAGRYRPTELVISRANKSVRMFEHVVSHLAEGRQPDADMVRRVGYLMRTTAVYGNGKFGLADRVRIAERDAFAGPFQAELLTVWLIRGFSHDLAEHVARERNPHGWCPLAGSFRRGLGIGNATGLGMAPFLVGHPVLINNWFVARETALARVRARKRADAEAADRFLAIIRRAQRHVRELEVGDLAQSERNATLAAELATLASTLSGEVLHGEYPWERVIRRTQAMSLELQELAVSAVMEPHGWLVDELGRTMSSRREFELDPSMTVGTLLGMFNRHCQWALAHDFSKPESDQVFWYVSEEKLEPRIGDKYREEGAELALPLDIARQFQELHIKLRDHDQGDSVAEFLMVHHELRRAVRRVQNAETYPYAEIRDNLVARSMRPIDLLRSKLAFFGATKFDPKSDLWTRITMYQGAPLFDDIGMGDADDWSFPVLCRP